VQEKILLSLISLDHALEKVKQWRFSIHMQCFSGLFRGWNGLSKYSRISLHNHHQNTLELCFMTYLGIQMK